MRIRFAFLLAWALAFCAPAVAMADEGPSAGDLVPATIDMTAADDAANEPATVVPTPLYRLYNIRSGEHFYTASTDERDYLLKIGWFDEGTGWVSPSTSNTPVYRLYNPNAGDHHYTINREERDHLVKVGWNDEGIGWYAVDEPAAEDVSERADGDGEGADGANREDSDGATGEGTEPSTKRIPLYRQYNPNAIAGAHNFTTNKEENDFLVNAGWHEEGIAWYVLESGSAGDDMWLSPAHLIGLADGIPSGGSVMPGYKTSISSSDMAALNEHAHAGVEVAFLAINTRTGESVGYQPDSQFYGASTIKAPYIAALCKYSAPGVAGWRDTMYDVITYSDNYGFNQLSSQYGTFYEQSFANEWGTSLDFNYGGDLCRPQCAAACETVAGHSRLHPLRRFVCGNVPRAVRERRLLQDRRHGRSGLWAQPSLGGHRRRCRLRHHDPLRLR